jgi:predicted DNA-binding transcriptional regulator AlpA
MLNEKEAAQRLGLSVATLRTWRCREKGPRFFRLGKAIRYSEDEIAQFLSESLHEPVFRAGS